MLLGKINDYTPLNVLGQGGFGTVYLVESEADKTKYAIKLISVDKNTKNDAKK